MTMTSPGLQRSTTLRIACDDTVLAIKDLQAGRYVSVPFSAREHLRSRTKHIQMYIVLDDKLTSINNMTTSIVPPKQQRCTSFVPHMNGTNPDIPEILLVLMYRTILEATITTTQCLKKTDAVSTLHTQWLVRLAQYASAPDQAHGSTTTF